MKKLRKRLLKKDKTSKEVVEDFNRQMEAKGMLLPDDKEDTMQIIFYRKKPEYPNKK